MPTKKIMLWTVENFPTPIIGLYPSVVDEGGDLAIGSSPFEQGEIMAHITATILSKQPVTPKIQSGTRSLVLERPNARIKLPEVYDSFSHTLQDYKREL
jgi:hypothetical protein